MATLTTVICDKCGDTCNYHYHMQMRYYNGAATTQAEADLCLSCATAALGAPMDWRKPLKFQPLVRS